MMMAAMMGQMMASSRDTTGSTEHSPTKLSKDDEEDTSTYGSSFNVSHPNYRPPDMEHKPGITDKRFIGRIKFWFETKGFGFIESEEFSKVFGGDSDVFLHHFQKRHYQQGDLVEFSVFINFRGKPQGTPHLKQWRLNPGCEKTNNINLYCLKKFTVYWHHKTWAFVEAEIVWRIIFRTSQQCFMWS